MAGSDGWGTLPRDWPAPRSRLGLTSVESQRPLRQGGPPPADLRNQPAASTVPYPVAMEKKTGRSKPTGQIPRLEAILNALTIHCGEGIANLNH